MNGSSLPSPRGRAPTDRPWSPIERGALVRHADAAHRREDTARQQESGRRPFRRRDRPGVTADDLPAFVDVVRRADGARRCERARLLHRPGRVQEAWLPVVPLAMPTTAPALSMPFAGSCPGRACRDWSSRRTHTGRRGARPRWRRHSRPPRNRCSALARLWRRRTCRSRSWRAESKTACSAPVGRQPAGHLAGAVDVGRAAAGLPTT